MNSLDQDIEFNSSIWSEESNESSSIGTRLQNLHLNTSLDSYESLTSRGNGIKISNENYNVNGVKSSNRPKISNVVLNLLAPNDQSSSGYSTSISPTNDLVSTSTNPPVICNQFGPLTTVNNIPEIPPAPYDCKKEKSSRRMVIRRILIDKIKHDTSKSSHNGYIVDYGDTILMKACRTGNNSKISNAIDSLLRHKQMILFDHKNYANETALSIVVHYMNEKYIDSIVRYSSPLIELSMGNNIMHVAASLTKDEERRVFGYLLNSINQHHPEKLVTVLLAKNIFNCDPYTILKYYHDISSDNCYIQNCIHAHLDAIDRIFHNFSYDSTAFST